MARADSALNTTDKRLLLRGVRKGDLAEVELTKALDELPDLSDQIRQPGQEELDALREELVAEQSARAERVQRILSEPKDVPKPPVEVTPFTELDF